MCFVFLFCNRFINIALFVAFLFCLYSRRTEMFSQINSCLLNIVFRLHFWNNSCQFEIFLPHKILFFNKSLQIAMESIKSVTWTSNTKNVSNKWCTGSMFCSHFALWNSDSIVYAHLHEGTSVLQPLQSH